MAQLARAIGSYPIGRWFKSNFRYHNFQKAKIPVNAVFTGIFAFLVC